MEIIQFGQNGVFVVQIARKRDHVIALTLNPSTVVEIAVRWEQTKRRWNAWAGNAWKVYRQVRRN